MRFVIGVILLALVAWTGIWFYAAEQIETGTENFLDNQAAEGWDIRHGAVEVTGFPYRFDLSVIEPEVASPDGGFGWAAPEAQVQALAYQPTHLIATLPERQSVVLGEQTFDIGSTRMQASIRTDLAPSLPLDHMTLEAADLTIASDAGWGLSTDKAIFATRRSEMTGAGPNDHDIVLTIEGMAPDGALTQRIDPAGRMPPVIGPLKLDGTVALDRPVDRGVFRPGAPMPEIQRLDLREASLVWGDSAVEISGPLAFDAEGLATGSLRVSVSGWQGILNIAVSLGLVPEGQRRAVEQAMRILDATRFGARTLDLTLPVESGVVLLGPIPVATLPRAVRN